MVIRFSVPAVPIAQPRQRHAIRGSGENQFVSNYTPAKHPVTLFKATVKLAFREAYQGPPLEGPLRLKAVFVFPRPKNMLWRKRDMPRAPHAKKPDLDNCLKSLKDALGKLAWNDDAQVSRVVACKHIAAGDEAAHVVVVIAEVSQATAALRRKP